MANQCYSDGQPRIGCFSRRLELRTWVLSVFLISCANSECFGSNVTVSTYPQGDIVIHYGKPLEIFCKVEGSYTAEDLVFSSSNGLELLKHEVINRTTIRYYEKRPKIQANTYLCKNRKSNRVCSNRVLIDTPPNNVTDFSCFSKNLDVLNCTWRAPHSVSKIIYTLQYSINGNFVENCTVQKHTNRWYSCSWTSDSTPMYRQQEEYLYFHLVSSSVFGNTTQNFKIDHFSVVRPDKPIDLKVLSKGSHNVTLQWSIPNNMVDLLHCGVNHKIQYQIAKIDSTTDFHTVNATGLQTKNQKIYHFTLTNLPYAHMQYEVRVYIRPTKAKDDQFWSNYSFIVFTTASERPGRPPRIAVGAFEQNPFQTKRVINVYWKQLEEYEEAGANFSYKVVIYQDNRYETVFANKSRSMSYVNLDGASLGPIHVTVWSTNEVGSSINSSHLYIPPKAETRAMSPSKFTKLAFENGTYELSWVGVKNINNYTLFWCQHNSTNVCADRLDFDVLDAKKSRHTIDLPREYRYQFAIAVNNGTRSSGMIWAKCDISKDSIAMYGFPVNLNYDAPGSTYVVLKWSMECALQDGIITGYRIIYCPVIQTSSECDKNVGNNSVYIDDPKKTEYNITGLRPYRSYQFMISLNTTYGLKTIENATAVVTTTEGKPTSPRNITVYDIKNDSLIISWLPPLHKNGIIGKYKIYNGHNFIVDVDNNETVLQKEKVISDLQAFTNYSFNVQACNLAGSLCSDMNPADSVFVRTRIGPPSRLQAPVIKNNPDVLMWSPPEFTGTAGNVTLYQIKIEKEGSELTTQIINSTDLSIPMSFCDGSIAEQYQVRGVNFDEDIHYGVLADKISVSIPDRSTDTYDEHFGEWSEPSTVACRRSDGLAIIIIFMSLFALIGMVFSSIRLYKIKVKREDIEVKLPSGLCIPEKENISKYAFTGWDQSSKDEKPSSDEVLLLPNSKDTIVSAPDSKQNESENCAASDHTDSTALSDTSRGPVDCHASTSDDGSNSSLRLEEDNAKENNMELDEENSHSETDSSQGDSPYFGDKAFKKNPTSGYVQPVFTSPSGYVQSAPAPTPLKSPIAPVQPASTSYVMAGLTPAIFTTTGGIMSGPGQAPLPTGYVRADEAQKKSLMNFPKLGPSPTNVFESDCLPSMPSLPQTKQNADSSYIQLQSLDSLPSLKPNVRNNVPSKPPASRGYVSTGDAMFKHFNNAMSPRHLPEDSAILDPTMSPDAYCRFSWSTDPANDNLNSLLADTSKIDSSKN